MRKIKEVLRVKFEAKLSHEKIAAATGMSKGAVRRALQQGLGWPLPAELDEAALEALMYRKPAPPPPATRSRTMPPSIKNSSAKASHCSCCGRNTRRRTGTARIATASSACIITNTAASSPARCARCTGPGSRAPAQMNRTQCEHTET
jgi:hypothetical protein